MSDPSKDRPRRRWRLWAGLVVVLVLWQAIQGATLGRLGVPGLVELPLGSEGTGLLETLERTRTDTVTTVAKSPPPPRRAPRPKTPPPQGPKKPERQARLPSETTPPQAPPPRPTVEPLTVPSARQLEGWVKSSAREFVGGVDAEGNILYRFDVWLTAPAALAKRIRKVAYVYGGPSATPKSRSSTTRKGGFRVKFGARSCEGPVAVTVTFDTGATRRVSVDGCRILN